MLIVGMRYHVQWLSGHVIPLWMGGSQRGGTASTGIAPVLPILSSQQLGKLPQPKLWNEGPLPFDRMKEWGPISHHQGGGIKTSLHHVF